jgi:hypothetical protein
MLCRLSSDQAGRRTDFPSMTWLAGSLAGWIGLATILMASSGCASSIYGWQTRTNSTPLPSSFHHHLFEEQAVALFPTVTLPALRGNEVAISYYLDEILHKLAPKWRTVSPKVIMTRINQQGLAEAYTKLMQDHEQINIFNRDLLRKIAGALGARYVFQPRLAFFVQTMTDRWKIPAFDVRVSQTRSSIMRLSLQLWDADSGELVWSSVAETNMANEAVSQDPVYLEDISRATLGSIISDLLEGKTASQYTPLNTFLNNLIQEAMPKEKSDDSGKKTGSQPDRDNTRR